MTRFQHIIDALQAIYADTTAQWFIGAEHVYSNVNWNRVVAYPTASSVRLPGLAAQGHLLENINSPQEIGARDDILWERRVSCEIGIWAESYAAAENRLHAMLVALAGVIGSSNLEIDSISERWLRGETKDITGGGALVVLAFQCTFYVLTADADVVAAEAAQDPAIAIGTGVDAPPIEHADITVIVDNESVSFGVGG